MIKIDIPGKKPVAVYGPLSVQVPGLPPVSVFTQGIKWLLRDEFSTDLAAGSVNGTNAEPGPGVRTVVDTESKLTINASGQLAFAGGKAASAFGDPGLWESVITRASGKMLIAEVTSASGYGIIGFDTGQTGILNEAGLRFTGGVAGEFVYFYSGGLGPVLGLCTNGVSYKTSQILRETGSIFLVKGGAFTNWTLLHISNTLNTATLYPAFVNYSGIFTSSFLRIPTNLWLPTPLLSDGFGSAFGTSDGLGHAEGIAGGLGSGGGGLAWNTAGTWATAGGVVANTPVEGVELCTDSGMDAAAEWLIGAGWDVGVTTLGVATHIAGNSTSMVNTDAVGITAGVWYQTTFDVVVSAGSMYPLVGNNLMASISTSGSKTQIIRAVNTNDPSLIANGVVFAGTVDNFSVKPLSISTLITNQSLTTTDVLAEQVISAYTLGSQVGISQSDRPFAFKANANAAAGQNVIVLKGLTSAVPDTDTITIKHPITPTTYTIASVSALAGGVQTLTLDANLVEAVSADDWVGVDWASWNGSLHYFDGAGNIKVDEVLAGVYTNRGSTATAFSAAARLIVRKVGSEYRVFYAEALIGTAISTIAAGAMTGTYWGMFSTLAANTISSFCVYDTGAVTAIYNSTLDKYSFN